jgi:hypothetical protein
VLSGTGLTPDPCLCGPSLQPKDHKPAVGVRADERFERDGVVGCRGLHSDASHACGRRQAMIAARAEVASMCEGGHLERQSMKDTNIWVRVGD